MCLQSLGKARTRPRAITAGQILVGLATIGGIGAGAAGLVVRLGAQPDGSAVVPTNQTVTPAGMVHQLPGSRPKDVAISPDGSWVAVLATNRVALFRADGAPAGMVSLTGAALGVAFSPDGQWLFASQTSGKVARLHVESGEWKKDGELTVDAGGPGGGRRGSGNPQTGGLAVSPDGARLYAALGIRNSVAVVNLSSSQVERTVPVGVAPYHVALTPDGRTLCVANRGGAAAAPTEIHAALSAQTRVRVDPETDAALSGSLSLIDTTSFQTTAVEVGRQPGGMAISRDGRTLYVANSDSDSISVVELPTRRVTHTVSVRPLDDPGFGQIPVSLALSTEGDTLFVACGGGNAIAVLTARGTPKLRGFIPCGWFPIQVRERDGRLVVANSKGIGARNPDKKGKFGVHATVGSVQFVAPADFRRLAPLTRQVARNNRWGDEPAARAGVAPMPVPARVGEPSVFRHVVYIIKENLTYDSVLGDLSAGNGDASLTLFPEQVSPNHHALAREFVLLDNTYSSGTNSADGHQWVASSVANGYMEHNYGHHVRSYPYDGGDPLAYSPAGFLWTAASRAGKSVRVYGEFVNKPSIVDPATGRTPTWAQLWEDYRGGGNHFRITADTDNAALKPFLHPHYIGFPLIVTDQWRADQFLGDFRRWEQRGDMPDLTMMLLPADHTSGTRAGIPTPRAQVADNDLALGRIVEAITRSRFWKDTLILVVQDDSQLGLDHVDGHRMPAFVISPYTRRGAVVSEPYNHTSFARTIGLVLGLPALNRFDRTGLPLTECFQAQPDSRPYSVRANNIRLDEMNPPTSALRGEARRLAEASGSQDWSDVDRAEPEVVARAVWHAQFPHRPFPAARFRPPADDDD